MSFWVSVFISLVKYLKVEFLDHVIDLFLICWGNYTVFHGGCTSFTFPQLCTRVPLLFLIFFITTFLIGVKWCLIVLICISMMIEHLFMCLFSIYMFSLGKCLFGSLACFLIKCVFFLFFFLCFFFFSINFYYFFFNKFCILNNYNI